MRKQALQQVGRQWRVQWWLRNVWLSVPSGVATGVAVQLFEHPLSTVVGYAVFASFLSLLLIGWARRRVYPTPARLAAHFDRSFQELQDSAGLTLRSPEGLTSVAKSQRARVERELEALLARGKLQPPEGAWHRTAALSLVSVAVLVNLPWVIHRFDTAPSAIINPVGPSILQAQLDERRHSYTRLAAHRHEGLSADILEYSFVRWTVRVSGDVDRISLAFSDQQTVPMFPAPDGYWQSDWIKARAGNYALMLDDKRFVFDGVASHRLVVLPDAPPEITILQPTQRIFTLDERSDPKLAVALAFADDYGLKGLRAVVNSAEGDGEQVDFERKTIDMAARLADTLPISTELDLKALGAAPGRELYVTYEVDDNRPDSPQTTASASLIVRWQKDATSADIVLDNQVVNIEPELFRSQRQIIIDSEALLDTRDTLSDQEFAGRAQGLAFDERALRFRYGAFMGEEASGEPAAGARVLGGVEHYPGDGHDHGAADFTTPQQREFGDVMAAIAPYAHFHDQEEQATVFDPETRRLLRQALSAMWRAEGFLLQHDPSSSLPHQYRALALIKRIQRRSRKFVRRVGVPITPVDEARRLNGELDDIPSTRELVVHESEVLRPPVDAFNYLASSGFDRDRSNVALDWLERRLRQVDVSQDANVERDLRDSLAVLKTWREDPSCGHCGDRLTQLWRKMAPMPSAAPRRAPRIETWFDDGRPVSD